MSFPAERCRISGKIRISQNIDHIHIDILQFVVYTVLVETLREVRQVDSPYRETARVFKAFCDENRLQILELLRSGEKCACKLLDDLQISQPTLSHHMKILCDANLVQGRKEGKWVHYSIDPDGAERAKQLLTEQLTLDVSCDQETCCIDEN